MVLAASWTSTARAEPADAIEEVRVPIPRVPIGFSKLVVRLDGGDDIGIGGADFRVRLIERMRSTGFDAVGAENLVFGKDESRRAEYLVGGTVREVSCRESARSTSCRVGVEWQVLDVARDAVVYIVTTRAAVYDTPNADRGRMPALLLDASLDVLLKRGRFRAALKSHAGAADVPAPSFEERTIPTCAAGRKLSESADDLLRKVVVVRSNGGFGSGFFISPEGLVLTAAHVVTSSPLTLRLRDGAEVEAIPVRIARRQDVALLRTVHARAGQACAALRVDAPSSGTEVYAAGAPASLDLAFSLTRGIVSGLPVIDGRRRLQTDAPVSPGNSGGPVVDANGVALGVVSFKIVSTKVEGVAFAVPTQEVLASLGLHLGDATDPRLLNETTSPEPEPTAAPFHDAPDPVPSLVDQASVLLGDAVGAHGDAAYAAGHRRAGPPASVSAMRWGGLTVGTIGLATVLLTYSNYSVETTTPQQFGSLRTWNTIGWIGAGVGAGLFGLSFALQPSTSAPKSKSATTVDLGPTGVYWRGAF